MKDKVVLGYPYHNVFYWLMSPLDNHHKGANLGEYLGRHPYYEVLYGSQHENLVSRTISICLLFEEILLAPADANYFQSDKYSTQSENGSSVYGNSDLGILSDWSWSTEFRIPGDLDILINDNEISAILGDKTDRHKREILRTAIIQIGISEKFKAPILANTNYLNLVNRISFIFNNQVLISESSIKYQYSIQNTFELSILNFNVENIDSFAYLRQNKNIIELGREFRTQISNLGTDKFSELHFYQALAKAKNTDSLASKVSGGLSLTATATSAVSLMAVLGAIGGPVGAALGGVIGGSVGFGLDMASRASQKVSDNSKWWLFPQEISNTLYEKSIEDKIKELENN